MRRATWKDVLRAAAAAALLRPAGAAALALPRLAPEASQGAFRSVAAAVKPAVVSIDTVFERVEEEPSFEFGDADEFLKRFFGQEEEKGDAPQRRPRRRHLRGVGSGVIIDARGYILTNEHVVGGAREIKVILREPKESEFKGKVIGTDPMSDLAVIKIEAGRPLPFAKLGDSDKAAVGDWAIAIGSPFGLEQTVTVGVVSAQRQSLRVEDRIYSNFLQTDAAINQGNSGGPLLNIAGEVVGINTAIFSPTGMSAGIGFAIPSNEAARVMKALIEKGRVVRGWAGIEIVPLNDVLSAQFKIPGGEGALVNRVLDGSPAAKAGLRRGDVVIEYDGKKVGAPETLTALIGQTAPGQKVALRIIRDGRAEKLTLRSGERPAKADEDDETPERPAKRAAARAWQGAKVQDLDEGMRARLGLDAKVEGAVVAEVEPDSGADQLGLRPGDVILQVNGRRVAGAKDLLEAAGGLKPEDGLVLDVNRQGQPLYLSWRKAR